jgi:hypothetical protein
MFPVHDRDLFVFRGEMSALSGRDDASVAECTDAIPSAGSAVGGHGHLSSGRRQQLRAGNCDAAHSDCRFSAARSIAVFAFISVHKVHANAL